MTEGKFERLTSDMLQSSKTAPSSIDLKPSLDCSDSFENIVRQYHLPLRAYLISKVGDLSVADDIAQEVFIAAAKNYKGIEGNAALKSWLFSVARNKAVDYLRKCLRNRETTYASLDHILAESRLNRTDDKVDLLFALRRCLEKLQPRAKSLVQAFYFQQMSSDEVAVSVGTKGSTVRMSLLRIRRSLASCIRTETERNFND